MSLFNQGEKAYLLLADGTILEGIHFGVKGTAIGEVVFTTGMTAYQETMTDPSYYCLLLLLILAFTVRWSSIHFR